MKRLTRLAEHHGAPWLLNVNIPNRPAAEIKPLRVTRLGRRHAAERDIERGARGGVSKFEAVLSKTGLEKLCELLRRLFTLNERAAIAF